jgi:hypothetical protein
MKLEKLITEWEQFTRDSLRQALFPERKTIKPKSSPKALPPGINPIFGYNRIKW